MIREDAKALEAASEEISGAVHQSASAILSTIEFPTILRDLELLPALGWRHLVLNLVVVQGEERIVDGARWIYSERLTGIVGDASPQEIILVAFGMYRHASDERAMPQIDGCSALAAGSLDLLKAVRFIGGDVGTPVAMDQYEFASKIRHARSEIGNPVIYRKARKNQDKEAAA
jgi:hypothetical protein